METTKYIASVSFGKDSLAMLLKVIETGKYKIDEVVFYDTGMEFKAIYRIRDIIGAYLKTKNIKFTVLFPTRPFEYSMFDKPIKHRDGTTGNGYSWCGGSCRWGTTDKLRVIDNYCKKQNAIQLVGIAYDEPNRYSKDDKKINPLVDFKMTEKDCLEFCYARGFYWEENGFRLYDILKRVSCWCCANKNLKELENYYKYLPEYWEKLKEFQNRTNRPFKNGKTIFDIEQRIMQRI